MPLDRTRSPTATGCTRILTSAGFGDIVIEPMEGELCSAERTSVDDAVEFSTQTGTLRALLGSVDEEARANAVGRPWRRMRAPTPCAAACASVGRVGRARAATWRQGGGEGEGVITSAAHRRQRVMGALVGSIVGDALGAPFEFRPGGVVHPPVPRARAPGPRRDGRWRRVATGGVDRRHPDVAARRRVTARVRGARRGRLYRRFQAWLAGRAEGRRHPDSRGAGSPLGWDEVGPRPRRGGASRRPAMGR